MNARTVCKLLMSNRSRGCWGQRAYLTVSAPLSIVPAPMPWAPPDPVQWRNDVAGYWEEGGRRYCIGNVWSNSEPNADGAPALRARLIRQDGDKSWTWWEGFSYLPDVGVGAVDLTPLPDEMVERFVALSGWHDVYLSGHHGPTGVPALDALHTAGRWARAVYPSIRGERIYWTFAVKSQYPSTVRRFCADIARAVYRLREAGVDIRIRRGRV